MIYVQPKKGIPMRTTKVIGIATLLLSAGFMAGCGSRPTSDTKGEEKTARKGALKKTDHDHGAGPHGGALAEWGADEYHAEFTVDHGKQEAVVYILGGDAKTSFPIQADNILLSIKEPSFQIELTSSPQSGDLKGKTSRFVGKHANFGKEQAFAGTISGQVDGKPYAGDFKQEVKGSKVSSSPSAASARESKVFLTPGGIYTMADIEKNGNTVPSVKFQGMFWPHDDNLMAGDKTCPVTDVKADAQCSWWVNGQSYEFCCPSCLEKFVKWAKETPERVKAPEAYVKK
jgi:YHS domain-containing protein